MTKVTNTAILLPEKMHSLADDPEAQRIAESLIDLPEETRVVMPLDEKGQLLGVDELKEYARNVEQDRELAAFKLGVVYYSLKKLIGANGLEGYLKDEGRSIRSANQHIKVFGLYCGLAKQYKKFFVMLPFRKQNCLSSLPAPQVQQLIDDGALDNAEQMKLEELAQIARLKKQNEKLDAANKEASEKLEAAIATIKSLEGVPKSQRRVELLRLTALDEIETLRASGQAAQSILDEINMLPGISNAEIDRVASSVMFQLQSLVAHSLTLFHQGHEIFSGYQVDKNILPPARSADEIKRAEAMLERAELDVKTRRSQREFEVTVKAGKAGRGRPKKGSK